MKKTALPLYGLVLSGGKSLRMSLDKSLLDYHGKPQIVYCYELLKNFCSQVFISGRRNQCFGKLFGGVPIIYDRARYIKAGPLAGILSAMDKFPLAAWLVLACDLPFLDHPTLRNLIQKRDCTKIATAYRSAHDRMPEPLCAIYEPHSYQNLLAHFKNKIYCPRKILMNSPVQLLEPVDPKALDNVNTLEEYNAAKLKCYSKRNK